MGKVDMLEAKGGVEVKVTDSGSGIPEHIASKVLTLCIPPKKNLVVLVSVFGEKILLAHDAKMKLIWMLNIRSLSLTFRRALFDLFAHSHDLQLPHGPMYSIHFEIKSLAP